MAATLTAFQVFVHFYTSDMHQDGEILSAYIGCLLLGIPDEF